MRYAGVMRTHAVIVGGSIAGLAAAKVLASRFDRVTIVERDALPDAAELRAGVPQGRQVHILLRHGLDLLEALYPDPGFSDELRAAGALELQWGRDVRWYHFGGWKLSNPSPFASLFCTRALIE